MALSLKGVLTSRLVSVRAVSNGNSCDLCLQALSCKDKRRVLSAIQSSSSESEALRRFEAPPQIPIYFGHRYSCGLDAIRRDIYLATSRHVQTHLPDTFHELERQTFLSGLPCRIVALSPTTPPAPIGWCHSGVFEGCQTAGGGAGGCISKCGSATSGRSGACPK